MPGGGRSTSIQVDHSIIRNDMSGILNPPLNETNYGEIIWGSGNVEGVSDPLFENAEDFQVNESFPDRLQLILEIHYLTMMILMTQEMILDIKVVVGCLFI